MPNRSTTRDDVPVGAVFALRKSNGNCGTKRYGAIKSDAFATLVLFDLGAHNAGGKPVSGSRISFVVRSSGTAYKIKRSTLKNYGALTRRKKVIQSPA